MYKSFGRIAEFVAIMLALAGGVALLAIIAISCVSIMGRILVPLDIGLGPIRGIYDITEIGIAVAIFAFLPWTHLHEAHARVDLFQGMFPKRVNKVFDLFFNIIMLVVAIVGTYRLYLGMLDKYAYGETTLIAQIPVWQGYALCLIGGIGFIFIAAFTVLRSAYRVAGLENEPPHEEGIAV